MTGALSLRIIIERSTLENKRANHFKNNGIYSLARFDLNFSPSTNLLPIRRLGLRVGQAAEVKAAWLRFPSFNVEPLSQIYHRLDETTYRYESAGGQFVAELQVNRAGFAVDYPGLWQAESAS